MKEQMCIVWVNICIWISFSTVVAESVNEGLITACAESDVDFFCGINETFELHIVLINHQSNEIGRYSYDTGVEVYQRFEDHYLIVKNNNTIQLRITAVREEDRGTLSCTIIYKTKRVKYESSLIIQEKLTSNIIDLKIKTGTCTVLTCSSSSSSQLELKKADNESIIGRDILLNSCIHNIPAGEFSCCLKANCSEAECKTIILQVESSTNIFIILCLNVTIILVLVMVAILIIFGCRTRLQKKKRKRLQYWIHEGQRDKSTHYQKDVTKIAKETQTSEMSKCTV